MAANFINTSGNIIANSGNFTTLVVNGTSVSNFNSSVSGLLPTIANSGDNRILTSTGSTVGINAETNLTFDGTNLNLNNQTASTIASFDSSKNLVSLSTASYPSLTELGFVKGVTSALQTQLDNKAASSHSHGNITSAGAIGSTANLPLITSTAGAITVGSFGSTANTFCQGNDSRLSDTRTPTDNTVTTAKIVNSNVTYAKLQNVSSSDRLLGRSSAGSGDVEEITCTAFGRSLIDDADAAAARTTLSVQPTASPAFTGNATFSGEILQGNGSTQTVPGASSVQAYNATSGGSAGIWAVGASGGGQGAIGCYDRSTGSVGAYLFSTNGYAGIATINNAGGFTGNPLNFTASSVSAAAQLLVTAGSAAAPGVAFGPSDTNTGMFSPGADQLAFSTNQTTRMLIDAVGDVSMTQTYYNLFNELSAGAGWACGYNLDVDGSTVERRFTGAISAIVYASDSLRFFCSGSDSAGTAPTERMRVESGGRVILSPNSEQYGLGVRYVSTGGPVYFGATSSSATPDAAISNAGGVTILLAKNDGEVIVGGTTYQGAYNLQCNGTGVWGAGAYVNGSDERIKDDITPLGEATSVIAAMQPVTFRYKPTWSSDRSVQPGFVAQQLQEALAGTPYIDGVVQQGTEYLSVAYQSLIPLLVKALQESNARIAALEERLNHA